MNNKSGYFMELQNFSVNDGNGIRTTIFFAGCPLRCQWCCNPESFTTLNKVAYYENTCLQCGRCKEQCSSDVDINLNSSGVRRKCKSCGRCVSVCPTNSRRNYIRTIGVEEILQTIEKQRIFYRLSGGGVTFSGGEATQQSDILRDLTYRLYDKGIDLAIETSGYFDFEKIKDILEKQSTIFVDIKHMDNDILRAYTGVDNGKILENISRMSHLNMPIIVRVPVIEGFNSDIDNIRKTAQFVKAHIHDPKLELLPYHSFGDSKYEALGMALPSRAFRAPAAEAMRELCKAIEKEGVQIVSYK